MALKSIGASAPVAPVENDEPQPLNLHALYQQQAACGYTRDLVLRSTTAQGITARLRGISAITSILLASSDSETLHLGEWLQHGLIEAVSALAQDAHYDLEQVNESAAAQKTH